MKTLKKIIEELVEENQQLKEQCDYFCKEYYEVVDENDRQDEFIKHLKKENYELQNTLIEHQINLYDKTIYIDKLKNELFNTYLLQQHQERLITELKIALSSYNNFVDEMFPD